MITMNPTDTLSLNEVVLLRLYSQMDSLERDVLKNYMQGTYVDISVLSEHQKQLLQMFCCAFLSSQCD